MPSFKSMNPSHERPKPFVVGTIVKGLESSVMTAHSSSTAFTVLSQSEADAKNEDKKQTAIRKSDFFIFSKGTLKT